MLDYREGIKLRTKFTFWVFVGSFLLIIIKAVYIQVVGSESLKAYFRSQTFRSREFWPHRGQILDRNGAPLALNIQTYSIFTIPRQVKDKKVYKKLSKLVPLIKYQRILKKIKGREKYTWIARKIRLTSDQAEKVKSLPGVFLESVPKRSYPNHDLASQILGFVGVDNTGLSGAEYYFDKSLKGRPRIIKYIKDAKGRPVKFENRLGVTHGEDIYLSIDKDLQALAEFELKNTIKTHKALSGGVGIIDAKSGEILAMANWPNYDPNNAGAYPAKNRKLSFISDPIEPGSVLKIFTVASALENKVAEPHSNYFCEYGKLEIDGHIINEADRKKKHEWLSVEKIIAVSSNIGTTKIAFDLGFQRLKKTLSDFGFGHKTNVELGGESRGIFPDSDRISAVKLSNISFGQGIAVTPIQLLSAYASIANDGLYLPPTLLKDGNKTRMPKRVITPKTARALQRMLIAAVEDGTGGLAKVARFTIAGKTSTAQRPHKGGGYKGHIPGFVGFPVNTDKRFVIYAYVDSPQGEKYYGNQVIGPLFKKISENILYGTKGHARFAKSVPTSKVDKVKIKSSAVQKITPGRVPNFMGLDKSSVREILKKVKVKSRERGHGLVVRQWPRPGAKFPKSKTVKLIYEPPGLE